MSTRVDGDSPAFCDRPVVIVAEDDFEMRRVLWSRLTHAGYRVREASDGLEAMERIRCGRALGRRSAPVALVADVRMARMDGLELLGQARALDPSLPVILITAFGDLETHAAAKRLGAVASFDKPLAVTQLLEVLRRVAPLTSLDRKEPK